MYRTLRRCLDLFCEKYLLILFLLKSRFLPSKKKKCLLISHEASLTGAPVVLYSLAKILSKNGWLPVLLSPYYGPLFNEANRSNLTMSRCHWRNFDYSVLLGSKYYDLIVVNTAVNGYVVSRLQNLDGCPILWWIHESAAVYSDDCIRQLPMHITHRVHIFAVGSYAKIQLERYRPKYNIQLLLYPSLDLQQICSINEESKTVRLYCIGGFQNRKAQDLLAQAIKLLPKEILNCCHFTFIGKIFCEEVFSAVQSLLNYKEVKCRIVDEMPREELYKEYQKLDVLVCPSRDDPMPVVVAEALSLGKIVICSTNTGSAKIINNYKAGIVFNSDSVNELVESIKLAVRVFNQKEVKNYYSLRARKAYEDNFSESIFTININRILANLNL